MKYNLSVLLHWLINKYLLNSLNGISKIFSIKGFLRNIKKSII